MLALLVFVADAPVGGASSFRLFAVHVPLSEQRLVIATGRTALFFLSERPDFLDVSASATAKTARSALKKVDTPR